MTYLLTILLCLLPAVLPSRAEVLELNHVCTLNRGEWHERLNQLIWWGYYADGCYVRQRQQVDEGDLAVSGNLLVFRGQFWRASAVCESWTSWDVEVEDRERMPTERREK